MKTRNAFAHYGLLILGAIALIVGLLTAGIGSFYIAPKFNNLVGSVDQDARLAADTLQAADKSLSLIQASMGLLNVLPETLTSAAGTLSQSADAIERTGTTLDSLDSGITGIALPDPATGKNIASLRKVAEQVRLLSAMTNEVRKSTQNIAAQSPGALAGIAQMQRDLEGIQSRLNSQVQSISDDLHRFPVSLIVIGASCFLGGIYMIFGILLISLSSVYRQMDRLNSLISPASRRAQPLGRAA